MFIMPRVWILIVAWLFGLLLLTNALTSPYNQTIVNMLGNKRSDSALIHHKQ